MLVGCRAGGAVALPAAPVSVSLGSLLCGPLFLVPMLYSLKLREALTPHIDVVHLAVLRHQAAPLHRRRLHTLKILFRNCLLGLQAGLIAGRRNLVKS